MLCSDQSLAPVVWLLSKVSPDPVQLGLNHSRMFPLETEIVRQRPASTPVLNYHHMKPFWVLHLYYSNTHMQNVHAGKRPDPAEYSRGRFVPGVGVPVDR